MIYVLNQKDKLSFIFWTILYYQILYVFLLLSSNIQNAWSTILGSFSSFNCFLTISYFSFVTELVCSCSKYVSKESLSSGISHTLQLKKYSIPFSFIDLRKVCCLLLYVNSWFELDKSRPFFIFQDTYFLFLLNTGILP